VPLPPAEVSFTLTLDIAPGDSNRFYVSAAGRLDPDVLVRSDDGGSTWTTFALPLEAEEYPYIAAVHPTDPDVLYVRTDFWPLDADGVAVASDGLLYSDDGGTTFREIHRAAGKLFGFALSPDASELVIGYGDPVESTRLVDPEALGIYRASTADHVFTKIFEGPVSCLSWTENGVYVCTSQRERGFALGIAPNADFDLAVSEPLTPLLDLLDVRGPLDCPACSTGAVCRGRWPDNCTVFGNCDAGAAAVGGGGGTDCSSGGSAGAGGSGNGAAGSGASGSGPEQSDGESSCGCRAAGAPAGAGALGALVLAASALARRRFRRVRGADEGTRTKRDP
jgi:MYXO-CTERM domain-containing protein